MDVLSFATKPTLVGERVTLRPVRGGDVEHLASTSPETDRLTGTHREFSLDELQRWYATRGDHDDRLDLAITVKGDDTWVGEVVLNDLDADNRSCGFRIMIGRSEFFGRGYGTEATRLVLTHAFETVGVHRVELEVYAFNPRAQHVYRSVGFVPEGTRRDALRWDGAWVDAHVMGLLAPEWAVHHGHPEV